MYLIRTLRNSNCVAIDQLKSSLDSIREHYAESEVSNVCSCRPAPPEYPIQVLRVQVDVQLERYSATVTVGLAQLLALPIFSGTSLLPKLTKEREKSSLARAS